MIENIYAGPQGSFVPKAFSPAIRRCSRWRNWASSSCRSTAWAPTTARKAFHDVCWKNLGDAGFPDRILWIKAAAAKYPYMDLTRVGIYGTSAGGQNALGGLLLHGDFYKVGVADCGCHDNRMDKIWWNEQWMGWPVGPQYAEQSNVTLAPKLQGKLLLMVGEMDTNVDPATHDAGGQRARSRRTRTSTCWSSPGSGHGVAGTPYGQRRLQDFFVRNLLGVEPRAEARPPAGELRDRRQRYGRPSRRGPIASLPERLKGVKGDESCRKWKWCRTAGGGGCRGRTEHRYAQTVEPGAADVAGLAGTNLGIAVADLPLKFLLKDKLHCTAAAVSAFFALGAFTNYIKPLAGVLVDGVPLFGTRRRWYLIGSLLGSGVLWLLLALVPRTYKILLVTYAILYVTIVFTSTSLGGVMVEVGQRFNAAGRLTAQRISAFRLGSLLGGPIGGVLSTTLPFMRRDGLAASFLHLILVPLYVFGLPEAPTARLNRSVWGEALRQFKILLNSTTLLYAALMIFLIAASPGFGTPLLFHQTNTLHFSKHVRGQSGVCRGGDRPADDHRLLRGLSQNEPAPARRRQYRRPCDRHDHLLYYHNETSAIVITAISGVTGTLAMLPVYDLAARGTPKRQRSDRLCRHDERLEPHQRPLRLGRVPAVHAVSSDVP